MTISFTLKCWWYWHHANISFLPHNAISLIFLVSYFISRSHKREDIELCTAPTAQDCTACTLRLHIRLFCIVSQGPGSHTNKKYIGWRGLGGSALIQAGGGRTNFTLLWLAEPNSGSKTGIQTPGQCENWYQNLTANFKSTNQNKHKSMKGVLNEFPCTFRTTLIKTIF